MASYKQFCMHCDSLIDSDSRFCPKCGSNSPFVLRCPFCLREISKGDLRCAECGGFLKVQCPLCGKETFAGDRCEICQASLMVPCSNKRCGEMIFFQNSHCLACGKANPNLSKKGLRR
jgi:RNA polymerase subunit RPABC4/transcription elongation factor Spt4